jgi:predicted RNA-binding Zn-ribbon protein involved in translation (DUF1610 family)
MEESIQNQKMRFCVSCGRTIDWDAVACPNCGYLYDQKSVTRTFSGMLKSRATASILMLVSGMIILTISVMIVLMVGTSWDALMSQYGDSYLGSRYSFSEANLLNASSMISIVGLTASLLTIVGAMAAASPRASRHSFFLCGFSLIVIPIGVLLPILTAVRDQYVQYFLRGHDYYYDYYGPNVLDIFYILVGIAFITGVIGLVILGNIHLHSQKRGKREATPLPTESIQHS